MRKIPKEKPNKEKMTIWFVPKEKPRTVVEEYDTLIKSSQITSQLPISTKSVIKLRGRHKISDSSRDTSTTRNN